MPVFVDEQICTGCGECVEICPGDLLAIDKVKIQHFNIRPMIVGIAWLT